MAAIEATCEEAALGERWLAGYHADPILLSPTDDRTPFLVVRNLLGSVGEVLLQTEAESLDVLRSLKYRLDDIGVPFAMASMPRPMSSAADLKSSPSILCASWADASLATAAMAKFVRIEGVEALHVSERAFFEIYGLRGTRWDGQRYSFSAEGGVAPKESPPALVEEEIMVEEEEEVPGCGREAARRERRLAKSALDRGLPALAASHCSRAMAALGSSPCRPLLSSLHKLRSICFFKQRLLREALSDAERAARLCDDDARRSALDANAARLRQALAVRQDKVR